MGKIEDVVKIQVKRLVRLMEWANENAGDGERR